MPKKIYQLTNPDYGHPWNGTIEQFEASFNEMGWDADLFLKWQSDGYEIWADRNNNGVEVVIEINEKSLSDRAVTEL